MSNISVRVEPQASVTVQISEPALAVSIIEGFMAIFRLGDLVDVDLSDLEDGSVLVYQESTEKWVATRALEQQYINAGQF